MIKIRKIRNILIWSADYRNLANWYIDNFEFSAVIEYNHPEDTGVLLKSEGTSLWIGQHSKVKGKNKDVHRHMVDFAVDSINDCYEILKSHKVKFYNAPTKDPTSDNYVVTLYDADDNLIQLVGDK